MRSVLAALVWLGLWGCAGYSQQRTEYGWVDGTKARSAGPGLWLRWSLNLQPSFAGSYIPVERAAPAIDAIAGRLYVGSTRGKLLALDADGRELYRYDAGAAIEAQPAVDPTRDEIYVATVRGAILALEGEQGKLRWKANVGAAVSQPPLLRRDALYVVTDTDSVVALARSDGSVLFRYRRDPSEGFAIAGHAGLSLSGNKLIAAFDSGAVVALDAGDGRVLWEVDTSADLEELDPTRRFADVDTTPALFGDVVYVASFSGGLYGLELETGTVRVHEGQLKAVTAISATPDALIVSSAEDGVLCLDLPQLTPRWSRPIQRGAPGKAEVQGDAVYVAESLGAFRVLALSDGQELGRIETAHGITAPAALENRRGFLLSNAAMIYAFSY